MKLCKYPYKKGVEEECDECGFCDEQEDDEDELETAQCGTEYEKGFEDDYIDSCKRCGNKEDCSLGKKAVEEDDYRAEEAAFNAKMEQHSRMDDKALGYWPVEPTTDEMREYILTNTNPWIAIPEVQRLRARAEGVLDPELNDDELREGVLFIIEQDFQGNLD